MKNNILSGLAGVLIAGATIFGMEKSGLSQAEGELREAATKAYYQDVPSVRDKFGKASYWSARISFDLLPAWLIGLGAYALMDKKRKRY